MKNPHIRTLPSHRPPGSFGVGCGFISARLYMKRYFKARRIWLLGKGAKPEPIACEIRVLDVVRFIESPI